MTFTPPDPHQTRPDLQGTFGMAATTHWLATATAQSVLERGGNAFDAATAAAFVLHVVEPHLNGPGGDMTGVFAAADGVPRVLAGQGPAPAAATIAHFRDTEGLDLVPGAGALAAAVPGAVDAWFLLLRDHGTWTVRDVLAHAVGYARDGHPVLGAVAATVERVAGLFTAHWPTSAERWMPGGRPPRAGEVVTNPEHASVLERLAEAADDAPSRRAGVDAARAAWREIVGTAAESFVATPHRHSDGRDHAGVLTADDVARFEAGYEQPTTAEFRGRTIVKTGAWGQGPVLLQALQILDGFDGSDSARLDPSTERGAHTILEALKLALADRDTWYGDTDVPLEHLLSAAYAAERRALIGETASHEVRPGVVPGRTAPPPPLRPAGGTPSGAAGAAGAGEPTVQTNGTTRGDTCHLDVVDRWGNMISATPSGGWLQSSPTVPGLGFCLGTRLQMTWLDEDSPSRLEPGRRPRTTLSPTLVLDADGVAVMACGTPGGDQQDQWQLPFLLRVLVGGYTPQQAIDAPALHTTSMTDSFWPRTWVPGGAVVESRIGADVLDGLAARGHVLTGAGPWSLGRLSAVTRDPATGVLGAAANSRGAQGYAAGR
ncbi:gamma-glutamyltranspeptidase/glutathione hydrolase [Isoptericola sp. CG 20/1183]|uniref:Gamma-glutamyltranspeptidase/glutathione hydrolase n=1 Tax=Isoptericola halotolerans TaxID=300560 RepID=A0ABX5EBQ0_9MICO|nr:MULTISPECIES: gamma-glutamyltransferase [Isoptericola]PRZ04928.1 gamma-glutamyltranspeptidase/glutathione hydrolase [Isoptericola halotolerans]PRZ05419.1 gamma-glutamyltranspeptidase/glutathione hydrolase [Isoptericola sp. CG 20/1183]